ncbi:hypothetical protein, partial [Ensifer adhaerens]
IERRVASAPMAEELVMMLVIRVSLDYFRRFRGHTGLPGDGGSASCHSVPTISEETKPVM